jgi:hypothetical protein
MLENTSGNKTFVSTFEGKFTVKSDANNPRAKKRVNKNNVEVFELQFDTITGVIENIFDNTQEGAYGTFRNIVLIVRDGDEVYSLSVPYSSRESKGILMRLPNADITKPIKIKIGRKEHIFTWITQNEVTVPLRWTKDAPGDMPRMVQTGDKTWDDTDQMAFLYDYIQKHVLIKPTAIPDPGSTDVARNVSSLPTPTGTDEDLPF